MVLLSNAWSWLTSAEEPLERGMHPTIPVTRPPPPPRQAVELTERPVLRPGVMMRYHAAQDLPLDAQDALVTAANTIAEHMTTYDPDEWDFPDPTENNPERDELIDEQLVVARAKRMVSKLAGPRP